VYAGAQKSARREVSSAEGPSRRSLCRDSHYSPGAHLAIIGPRVGGISVGNANCSLRTFRALVHPVESVKLIMSNPNSSDGNVREDIPLQHPTNDLVAYRVGPFGMKLVIAPAQRAWIDETEESFASRCLPMLIANQAGWVVLNDRPVRAIWHGGVGLEDIELEQTGAPPHAAVSHFGYGVLTFTIPFLFRTGLGTALLIRGIPNNPKDGIAPLEGIVETDWSVATATMNWKFTRANLWVEFDHGEPLCMVVPQRLDFLEGMRPRTLDIKEDPEIHAKYRAWKESRRQFLEDLRKHKPETVKQAWQKHYFQGTAPHAESDNRAEPHQHRTRLHLSEFS
jgi:hypothetical protein